MDSRQLAYAYNRLVRVVAQGDNMNEDQRLALYDSLWEQDPPEELKKILGSLAVRGIPDRFDDPLVIAIANGYRDAHGDLFDVDAYRAGLSVGTGINGGIVDGRIEAIIAQRET